MLLVQNSRTQNQEIDSQEIHSQKQEIDPQETLEMSLNNKNRQEIKESKCTKSEKNATNGTKRSTSLDLKQQLSPTSSTSLLQELMIQLLPSEDVSQLDESNFTCFEFDTAEHLMLSVLYIQQDCPAIMRSKSDFIDAMSQAFDKAQNVEKIDGL